MTDQSLTIPRPLNLIGGTWRAAALGRELPMISPIDGMRFASIADSGPEDVAAAIDAARAALGGEWGGLTAAERGRLMLRLALRLEAEAEALARLETRDNGKPIAQSRADMAALVRYFEYYGGAADKLHGEVIPFLNGYDVMSLREAHGVTGHIIPWNYPVQIFGRSVGVSQVEDREGGQRVGQRQAGLNRIHGAIRGLVCHGDHIIETIPRIRYLLSRQMRNTRIELKIGERGM